MALFNESGSAQSAKHAGARWVVVCPERAPIALTTSWVETQTDLQVAQNSAWTLVKINISTKRFHVSMKNAKMDLTRWISLDIFLATCLAEVHATTVRPVPVDTCFGNSPYR